MDNTEKMLEFDKIKEKWSELALTDAAKEKIRAAKFYLSEGELRRELRDTTDARSMIELLGNPPLQNVGEIKEILLAADKGECLTPYQLERVEKILAAVRRLKDYLSRAASSGNQLGFYGENLDALGELKEEISRQIRNGAVDDYASKELSQIRSRIDVCGEKMRQKAEQVMRSNKECMADSFCTMRNGRVCVPVKKEYKFRISGSVIDRSSTGATLFIEPSAAAAYYEELELLKISEENEVCRILYTLTAAVADAACAMNENIAVFEKLDFIFSKGKLSIDLRASEPSVNTERRIVLEDARHPLMDIDVSVPLRFETGGDIRGIVITGPNTGGKTVAIKTVMLNCMMAQCGLHVTCQKADICMSSSYLCDIGDGQSLSENLSTFSAHIKNVLEVLSEVNKDSLVIMDELGSGTDPAEGMGIAVAILEELHKSGCLFLVTTHYPEVKDYADRTQGIVNARMTFDKATLMPTYRMVIGEAGESCAFYIADSLGMPADMLKTAVRAAYGEAAVDSYSFRGSNTAAAGQTAANPAGRISKLKKAPKSDVLREKFKRGDSVIVFPDQKIGIVCEPVNEKGVLRVQLPDKKIWINHKRVKPHVAADELYPDGYDFSIIFETVENRKIRHEMERKYTDKTVKQD